MDELIKISQRYLEELSLHFAEYSRDGLFSLIGHHAEDYLRLVLFVGILFLSLGFLINFFVPALRLGRTLKAATKNLAAIKKRVSGAVVDLDEIAKEVMKSELLSHLWSEYAETLHPQKKVDDAGQSRTIRWRATASAETFFSEQALVDSELKADYYKHLPGILTGIGIIGTFSGLIFGLNSFKVSGDPQLAQAQLTSLMDSVGHAFFISAVAIGLAMFFTLLEKSLVTKRYSQVEKFRHLIDSLFDSGAGEEYLERLVTASESQATHAAQIKDALVVELREILTKLTEKQIEEQARQSGLISLELGKSIGEHLGGPMAAIATAVNGVKADQGDAVNKMLTDVLAGFSAQMQEMFGGQMHGLTDLLKETSEAMKQTSESFGRLATNMDSAGKGAVEAMGERLNQAITSMEARQGIMNSQMGEFVGQIRELVSESQSESAKKLQETLGALGEQVAGVVADLRRQSEEAADSQGHRQQRFQESSDRAVATLSAQMERLMAQSIETNRALQETVSKLSASTNEAITGMNAGAETLFIAASDFAKAGQGVADTMSASVEATGSIKRASETLLTASSATKDVLVDYGRTRDSFTIMVAEFNSIIDNAKREAAMSSDVISRMEAAASQLSTAQKQSEDYLKGINDVLAKVHESFSENVVRTLREGNREFQTELRTAVSIVSAAVKELGETLDDLPSGK